MKILKKTKFIPAVLCTCAAAVLVCVGIARHAHRLNAPEKAVRDSLMLIEQQGSKDAADLFAPSASGAQSASFSDLSDTGREALRAYFSGFSFRILDSHIDGETAAVDVEATGFDADALARSIRKTQLRQEYNEKLSDDESTLSSDGQEDQIYTLMKNALSSGSFQKTVTRETIHLTKNKRDWTIVSDSALRTLLTGGLIEKLNDPDLLSPNDVLSVYLDRYKTLSPQEWAEELNSPDLFQISSQDSEKLNDLYYQKAADVFKYTIEEVRTEGSVAQASIQVTVVDMSSVLSSYHQKLIDYAKTTDSITADDSALSGKSVLLLREALEENADPKTVPVSIRLENRKSGWQIVDTSGLTNALLGDMTAAADLFHES